jgi:hypothetical protein
MEAKEGAQMIRFLIGSSLLFLGTTVMASGAITLIGLPVGMFVFAAGMELLVGSGTKRSSTRGAG